MEESKETKKETKKLVNSYTFNVRGKSVTTLTMTAEKSGKLAAMMRSGDTFVDYDPYKFQQFLDVLVNEEFFEERNITEKDLLWFEVIFESHSTKSKCDFCKEKLDDTSKIRCNSCNFYLFEAYKTKCYFCNEEFYPSMDSTLRPGCNVGSYKFHRCCYEICDVKINYPSNNSHHYEFSRLLYFWRSSNKSLLCTRHLGCVIELNNAQIREIAIKTIDDLRTQHLNKK